MLNRLLAILVVSGFLQVCAAAAAAPVPAEDGLTAVPLEQLLDMEIVTAAKLARQISDAPSAVSVVTRQDIKTYGYRTLAEILNSMRGVYVTNDFFKYAYVGGRGYGTPGDYAGRLLLMIDGYKATENFYDSAFLPTKDFSMSS